jgi:hypothetical protein
MKIIVIGDLHGEFPNKVEEFIKKEKADLILCTGDFANFENYRKIVFSNTDKKVKDLVNKKDYHEMMTKIIKSMEKPLKVLDSFNVPVYTIYGNLDYTNYEVNKHRIKTNTLNRICKNSKNIHLVREKILNYKELQLLLFSGYRKNKLKFPKTKTQEIERLNKSWRNRISKLFSKMNSKTTIFVSHDLPFNTKLDLINNPNSPLNGKHVGDEVIREFIEKYQPKVAVCGHMHENQGIDKIGKSLIINAGYGKEGQFLILSINRDEIKYELKKLQ